VAILDPVGRHMEVIVDDTQLSLAIGKKGQNVRLAAKLLGWRIDIKSEEEKRQEVESQMAALVPGAPISVLTDYGLQEAFVGILMQSGINTVERLGAMTPEDLEGIPGVEHEAVPGIQSAVISYFNHMESAAASEPAESVAEESASGEAEPMEAEVEPVEAVESTDSEAAGEERAEASATAGEAVTE
jgi:N utilization substance protein A